MRRGGASTSNRLPLSRLAYPLIILRVISDESPTLSLFLLLQIKNKLSSRYAVSLEINTRKCRYYDTLLFTVIYYTVPLNPDAHHTKSTPCHSRTLVPRLMILSFDGSLWGSTCRNICQKYRRGAVNRS